MLMLLDSCSFTLVPMWHAEVHVFEVVLARRKPDVPVRKTDCKDFVAFGGRSGLCQWGLLSDRVVAVTFLLGSIVHRLALDTEVSSRCLLQRQLSIRRQCSFVNGQLRKPRSLEKLMANPATGLRPCCANPSSQVLRCELVQLERIET